ncbi:MAG: hypothetical protein LBC77_08700, partial [Spirochaetaceae bacterium]|nr:hypothetical protein [Spirochaetaceae bacterium]
MGTVVRPARFVKRLAGLALFLLLSAGRAAGVEYEDGRVKLVINDSNGKFMVYYMTDVDRKTYEPLFWDRNKTTSFIAVYLDGSEYRLGESARFKMYHRGTDARPALVFESPLIAVTVTFSFIRTASSGVSNGIRVDVKIENWSEKTVQAGARV